MLYRDNVSLKKKDENIVNLADSCLGHNIIASV